MHNKSFTVDNQRTIVGGRNIGDEYFATGAEIDFGDLDLLAVGPVVGEVSDAFDKGVLKMAYRLALYRDAWNDESIRWVLQEEDGEKIFFDEPNVGFWKKLGVGILGLLPIESQL